MHFWLSQGMTGEWSQEPLHRCNDHSMLSEITPLGSDEKVTLDDGSSLNVAGEGTVDMYMILSDGTSRVCLLKKALYIPELAYNLVSFSRATEAI